MMRTPQNKRTQRGVTLIEMLIAMSVVSCVLLAVVNVLNSSQRLWNNQVGRAQSILEADQAMDLMCQEIGGAVSVGTDVNGLTYFLTPDTADTSGNFLPSLIGGILGYKASGAGFEFYLSNVSGAAVTGTSLWRGKVASDRKVTTDPTWSKLPGGVKVKLPNVSALTYTTAGLPANTVRVSLTVNTKEGGQSSPYTVTRIVYLSNHN